jgi:hypothetical protein
MLRLAVLLVAGLLLAGCGGGSSPSAVPSGSPANGEIVGPSSSTRRPRRRRSPSAGWSSSTWTTLRRDPDGGPTLLLQHESPGPEWEANWLPAPAGPFMALRLYWPKDEATSGTGREPPLQRL